MKLKVIAPLGLLFLMLACTPSTQMVRTWKDPGLTPENLEPFKKVIVIARIGNETSNRIAEDKIVASMKTPAVPSYSILTLADTNEVAIDAKLQENGIDGMLVMLLSDVNKTLNYQPGTYYGGYYGYRGFYSYGYATPGYLTEDKTYYVETSIYSLISGKMMWSGTTTTLNPTQLDQTLDDIIAAIKMELTSEGFIKDN
jgi:hypothetical protein